MAIISIKDVKHIVERRRQKTFFEFLDEVGRIDHKVPSGVGPFQGIVNCWKNEPCIIVATGPSLKDFDLKRIKGMHSIGINHIIEDFDKFEWFFFLDQRFLNKTTYNIKNFKGKIFCQNNCYPPPGLDVVKFRTIKHRGPIDLDINKGLFKGVLSGLAALHLALITGANPIYLIGFDCGGLGATFKNYHYKATYTGETKTPEKLSKFKNTVGYFKVFRPWANRIINLSSISEIKVFQKKDWRKIPIFNRKPEEIKVNQTMKICHVAVMQNIQQMGDISRNVFELSKGNHIYTNIEADKFPKADIYLLECFINKSKKFIEFKKPYINSKVISLIHSSSSCMPAKCSDAVVVLTDVWKKYMKNKGFNSVVIPAGIEINNYHHGVDYDNKVFGRITRYSTGKVHPRFNEIALNILEKYQDSKCIMMTKKTKSWLNHPRFIIDDSININEVEKKAEKLSQLSVYTDMHNTFLETFSLCLLEAMAAGLCCILYSKVPQPAMQEVTGNTAIWCNSVESFQKKIIEVMENPELKKSYGVRARERAKEFSIENMIKKYNELFERILKC